MAVRHNPYPASELGTTLRQDSTLVRRADLIIGINAVRALRHGYGFRLSIIADHDKAAGQSYTLNVGDSSEIRMA